MSILIKWLMVSCLHRLLPVRMQSKCTLMGTFVTLTSLLFLQMVWALFAIFLLLTTMTLNLPIQIWQLKRKQTLLMKINPLVTLLLLLQFLQIFFALHPDFHPDVFLGDFSFDSAELYSSLINDFHFSKALIPYNPRNESTLKKVGYNEYGYPTCPNDPSLAMKYHGATIEKGRANRTKWGCPKMHYHKGWICDCKTPCSTAVKGRTTYTYENMELRMFPGIQRDSKEWDDTYKIRAIVERAINHFKINMCIAGRKTRNHITTKADVFLAGIASQLTVIVAYAMNCPQYIRSLKPLVV